MVSGSLGIVQNSTGQGYTDSAMRWTLDSLFMNDGVVSGLDVIPNNNLTYSISHGTGVCSVRNGGKVLLYTDSTNTTAVQPGDQSYARYDSIFLKPLDPTLDSDKVGIVPVVVSGSPSATPQLPTAPEGYLLLATFYVKPGVTNLSTGSIRKSAKNYAIPYGGALGKIGQGDLYTGGVPVDGQWHLVSTTNIYVPTDRNITVVWDMTAKNPAGTGEHDYAVRLRVDDVVLDPNTLIQLPISNHSWTQQYTFFLQVDTGSHRIQIDVLGDGGIPFFTIERGHVFVMDKGVAQ
jgi:hypothetical protein